jgi:hypothetical protein
MFAQYFTTLMQVLTARGSFDTTPEMLVNHVLEILAGLVQADQIATQGEIEDVVLVRSAHEATVKDVIAHTVDALNRTRILKAFAGQADLTQQTSDEWWREVDLLASDLELLLDRVDPRELDGWLQSRW